jgi:methylmalonyl-CoA/ethylmalonyl-CoA epimerase
MIKRIDHIAIVVEDIDAALGFWSDALGLDLAHVEDVPDQESAVAFLPTGESEVELVKPTTATSGVARYLAKRGPGIHHICFEVDDIDATLAVLKTRGIRLIDETPRIGTGGKQIAFIHPESTHGVLVELYELSPHEPHRRLERAHSLADRVMQESRVMGAAVLGFLRGLVDQDGRSGGAKTAAPAGTAGAAGNGHNASNQN